MSNEPQTNSTSDSPDSDAPMGNAAPGSPDATRKVFFCYSHHDVALATKIHDHLSALPLGLSVWMAAIDASNHEHYNRQVTAAISESDALVLLLTPEANQSNQVESEVGQAFTQKKRIVVLCVNDERPGDGLRHFIGLYNWLSISPSLRRADLDKVETAVLDAVQLPEKLLAARELQMKRTLWQSLMSSSRTVKTVTIAVGVIAFVASIAQIWGVWFAPPMEIVDVTPKPVPLWTRLFVNDFIDGKQAKLLGWIGLDNIDRTVFVGQSIKAELSPTPAGSHDYLVFVDKEFTFVPAETLVDSPLQWRLTESGSLTTLLVRSTRELDAELEAVRNQYGTKTLLTLNSDVQLVWKDTEYEIVETHARSWEPAEKPRISDWTRGVLDQLKTLGDVKVTGRTIAVSDRPTDEPQK